MLKEKDELGEVLLPIKVNLAINNLREMLLLAFTDDSFHVVPGGDPDAVAAHRLKDVNHVWLVGEQVSNNHRNVVIF